MRTRNLNLSARKVFGKMTACRNHGNSRGAMRGFRLGSVRSSISAFFRSRRRIGNGSKHRVKNLKKPKVLNLFGYTGIASIVAAKAGAEVTHVDASKQSNAWAKENAELSGVAAGAIRFLEDDALKFVLREVRRGAEYDGIILDPPAFGRGPANEVWRIEEHLPSLLQRDQKIFSKKSGAFFLLNGYAAGYSATSFLQAVAEYFRMRKASSASFRFRNQIPAA